MIVAEVYKNNDGVADCVYYASSKDPLKVQIIEGKDCHGDKFWKKSIRIFDKLNERENDYDMRIDQEEDFFKGFSIIVLNQDQFDWFKEHLKKDNMIITNFPMSVKIASWIHVMDNSQKLMIIIDAEGMYHDNNFIPLKITFTSSHYPTKVITVYYNGHLSDDIKDKLAYDWITKGSYYNSVLENCKETYQDLYGETLGVWTSAENDFFKDLFPDIPITLIDQKDTPECVMIACWVHNKLVSDMLASVFFPFEEDPILVVAKQKDPDKRTYFKVSNIHCFRRLRQYFTQFGAKTVYIQNHEKFFKEDCRLSMATTMIVPNNPAKSSQDVFFRDTSVPFFYKWPTSKFYWIEGDVSEEEYEIEVSKKIFSKDELCIIKNGKKYFEIENDVLKLKSDVCFTIMSNY